MTENSGIQNITISCSPSTLSQNEATLSIFPSTDNSKKFNVLNSIIIEYSSDIPQFQYTDSSKYSKEIQSETKCEWNFITLPNHEEILLASRNFKWHELFASPLISFEKTTLLISPQYWKKNDWHPGFLAIVKNNKYLTISTPGITTTFYLKPEIIRQSTSFAEVEWNETIAINSLCYGIKNLYPILLGTKIFHFDILDTSLFSALELTLFIKTFQPHQLYLHSKDKNKNLPEHWRKFCKSVGIILKENSTVGNYFKLPESLIPAQAKNTLVKYFNNQSRIFEIKGFF